MERSDLIEEMEDAAGELEDVVSLIGSSLKAIRGAGYSNKLVSEMGQVLELLIPLEKRVSDLADEVALASVSDDDLCGNE